MADEYTIFGDVKSVYPGRVHRLGPPIDWAAIKSASVDRERRDRNRTSESISAENSSHTTAISSQSHTSRPPSTHLSASIAQKAVIETQALPRDSVKSTDSGTMLVISPSDKLRQLLKEPAMNLEAVKKMAWAGLPDDMRPQIWKILLGYVPTNMARRKDTLRRKRLEYREAVEQHYVPIADMVEASSQGQSSNSYSRLGNQEDSTMRQICIDIPRTCPGLKLFHIAEVQLALQRVLYVWATRHPASGYVQGMNDLVTPFFYAFLSEYVKEGFAGSLLDVSDLSVLHDPEDALANSEADAYWCLTALLNDIQDYYTFSQPGIQKRVHFLKELVSRVDSELCLHLQAEGLNFLQFSFRWMNCLLMRELPFPLIVRVWDTYLAETDGFAVFHVYVCAALLVSFSEELLEMDFQDLVMFLQNLPTASWSCREIDIILSQAYMWRTIFGAAPSHLQ